MYKIYPIRKYGLELYAILDTDLKQFVASFWSIHAAQRRVHWLRRPKQVPVETSKKRIK